MTKNKTSEAQLRANKKRKEKNKIKVRMSRYRTTARTFIRHYATRQELEEFIQIFENENPNGTYSILNNIKKELIGKITTIENLENYIINTLYGTITTNISKNNIIEENQQNQKYIFFSTRGVKFKLIIDLIEKNENYKNMKIKIKNIIPAKI